MEKVRTVREESREIPVYAVCDVLVVGGGPAGCAAAASAADTGAEVILIERYGCLGGMSTDGLVLWLENMTDWSGKQVITGFADEILGRLPEEARIGPPRDAWGSRDPELVAYWKDRASAFNGIVTSSPTYDLEMMKLAYFDSMKDRKVRLLLHSWVVETVKGDAGLTGVIFESKSGRKAVRAKKIVDATGDGDIFAMAGESFETDIFENSMHHQLNVGFLWAGVDMGRYFNFRNTEEKRFNEVKKLAVEKFNDIDCFAANVMYMPHVMPRNDVCLFMSPKLNGFNCLDIEDLTTVEMLSREIMMRMLAFFREFVPGFADAWVMLSAPQIGVRHSRRLGGVERMSHEAWTSGKRYQDEIAVSPPPNTKSPNVSVPLACLIPGKLENLIVAGRNLSCDAVTHNFMRLIPQCWQTGQAAGVAAALASSGNLRIRDVSVLEIQRILRSQGVYMHVDS